MIDVSSKLASPTSAPGSGASAMDTAEMPAPPKSNLQYMRQLDGLRALAVFGVWMAHWGIMDRPGFDYVNWGTMGVMLFFVLSGFLITGILLKARDSVDAGDCGVWTAAKVFYIRRFLRIVPIYYLTLVVMALLLPDVRDQFVWYATYTTNIHLAVHPIVPPPVGGHFWSLAAEEQFYLVWPWVVFFVPRALKLPSAFFLIACGVALRVFLAMHHHHAVALGCIDQFGLGALLAMVSANQNLAALKKGLMALGSWVAFPATVALHLYLHNHPDHAILSVVIMPVAATLFFTWLIGAAGKGFKGPAGRILESTPLVYLGRISYGLYIYHGFLIALWAKAGLAPIANPWLQTLTFGAISVVMATFSWYTIEGPVNSLKRYFQMPRRRGARPAERIDGERLHGEARVDPRGDAQARPPVEPADAGLLRHALEQSLGQSPPQARAS